MHETCRVRFASMFVCGVGKESGSFYKMRIIIKTQKFSANYGNNHNKCTWHSKRHERGWVSLRGTFPRIDKRCFDVTVIMWYGYIQGALMECRGVQFVDVSCPKKKSIETIVHIFHAVNVIKSLFLMSVISMQLALRWWLLCEDADYEKSSLLIMDLIMIVTNVALQSKPFWNLASVLAASLLTRS